MRGTVLLTGATGFLGMELLARLLERDEDVAVIVRAEHEKGASERLGSVLERLYDQPPPAAKRVRVLRGDLQQSGLGLSVEDRRWLAGSVDRIIHCAASISFDLPLEQARAINVEGVRRVLELAREIASRGGLRRLVHVSTAYVSGHHAGEFGERDLDRGQSFRNSYEQSKHEAERLMADAAGELPVVIARPSMVVGHGLSGWTPAFNVIYWPIRAYERGLLTEIPARADSLVDFVPVDYVAAGIEALLDSEQATGVYNLVAGAEALRADELLSLLALLPREGAREGRQVRLVGVGEASALPLGALSLLPYFDVRCQFNDERASALLGQAGVQKPHASSYLARMIGYARASAWGKRPMSRQGSLRAMPAVSLAR